MISQKSLGFNELGREIILFTMKNASGASASVMNFGGHLTSVVVPDQRGTLTDVVLGYDTWQEYREKPGYLGAVVGRYGNRIGNARFSLNGKEYPLFPNDGKNSLHGGKSGFDQKVFDTRVVEGEQQDQVIFSCTSPDGEEGYPGTLHMTVTYAWDHLNQLTLEYHAVSDQDTVFNPTNHAYFNLHGHGEKDVRDLLLTLHADQMTEADNELIPTGNFVSLQNTALDFTSPRTLHSALEQKEVCAPVKQVNGLDFNFCIAGEGLRECAVLVNPENGIAMTVSTTEPGIQVYSGQGLDTTGKGGKKYGVFAGMAMETQHYPDSPNKENFPSVLLKKGETFTSVTCYAFSVK